MPDIVQKVKYSVEVDASELDAFKAKIDGVNTSVGSLNTTLKAIKGSVDKGLLSSISSLNTRLTRTAKVGAEAATGMQTLAAPLGGLQTSLDAMSAKFSLFNQTIADSVRDLRAVNAEMAKVKTAQTGLSAETGKSTTSMGKSWLRAFGVFQSAKYAIQQVWEAAKEGAQQLDLDRVLGKQFDNFEATIRRAQELTQGTVGRGSLTRSFALMSSFGIPMDQFSENMELVQKMAIRTGQSAEFLTDSFARGISRLSPLILDNLGIQVSLGEANRDFAAKTGVLTTEMTKEQRIAALLSHTLEKMKTNTEGVSLSAESAAASANRAAAAWDDFWLGVKEFAGGQIQKLDVLLQGTQSAAKMAADRFRELSYVLVTENNGGAVSAVSKFFDVLSSRKETADLMGGFDPRGTGVTALQNIQGQLAFFEGGLDKIRQFREATKNALVGTAEFNAALQQLNNSVGATEQETAALAMYDVYVRDVEASKLAAEQVFALWGDAITEKEKAQILNAQEALVSKDLAATMAKAKKLAEEKNIRLAQAVIEVTRETHSYQEQVYYWDEILLRQRERLAASDKAVTREAQALATAQATYQTSQAMFELMDGERLAKIDLNKILDQRRVIENKISDEQKKQAEAREQADDAALKKSQRAEVALYTELKLQDALRSTAQTSMLADKAMLDSFKKMTKEKLEATVKMVEGQLLYFQLFGAAFGDRATLEIQDRLNTLKLLKEAMEKPSGGGGSVGSRSRKDIRDMAGAASRSGGDRSGIAADARAWKTVIKDAREVANKLSVPGRNQPYGLLGEIFGPNFGTATPEDMKKARALAVEMKEAIALATRDGRTLEQVFTPQQLENMDIFNRRLSELEGHYAMLNQLARTFDAVGTAMQTFRDGMDGLFGANYVNLVGDLTGGFEQFSAALKENASAYDLVNAAMPGIRAFSQNLIKDRKAIAWIEALMQGAAAWAAYAIGNIPGGIMHTAAAGLYLAVAGGALRLPKGKSPDNRPRDDSTKYSQAKMRDIHLHIEGTQFMTDAERGAAIRDMMREAERAGL